MRAVLVAALLAGCAYRVPAVHAPRVAVASVEGPMSSDVRALLHARQDAPTVARVFVDVKRTENEIQTLAYQDGMAYLAMWALPLGLEYENATVAVDVLLDDGVHVRAGHGEATREGSLFAHAKKRALADALDRAIADASR